MSYTEHDVSMDERSTMEMIKKSDQQGVPVIDINGNIIVGFDQESIDNILGI